MEVTAEIKKIQRRMIELVQHPLPLHELQDQLLAWQQTLLDLQVQPMPVPQAQRLADSLRELAQQSDPRPLQFQEELAAAVSQL
jgi:hypothetical protein